MGTEEYFARLQQRVVHILAQVYQTLAARAAYAWGWGRTWITEQQVEEAIRRTHQRVMARLRSTLWQEMARQYLPLLVGLGVLLLLFMFWKLPQWYAASWDKLTDLKDIAKLESDTRTTMVQAVGGIALLAGLLFIWRNLRMTEQNSRQTLDLSRKGQINDRFIKTIKQLGAVDQAGRKKLEVRLGGVYALEQIAKDSPDDHHWPIIEILTAYVRENAPWKEEEQPSKEEILPRETQPSQSNQSPPTLAADIQAILTVVGRRTRTYGKGEDRHLNLGNTDLREAELYGAHLEGADLGRAHLERTHLGRAHLEGADLREAHLEGAILPGAHLEGAFLPGAHLEGADLERAHLEGAFLPGAHLEGADLLDAHLEGAQYLTVEQLAVVETLYGAHLDPPLLEDIRQRHPQLLEQPQK